MRWLSGFLGLVLWGCHAGTPPFIPQTEMDRADVVATIQIQDERADWTANDQGDRIIQTIARAHVLRIYKGSVPADITVVYLGGTAYGFTMVAGHVPIIPGPGATATVALKGPALDGYVVFYQEGVR